METAFRGKRLDNGGWVYGFYVKDLDGISYIITEMLGGVTICMDCGMQLSGMHRVDPDTVGQYIGLPDIKGNKIYKDDLIDHSGRILVIVWSEINGRWSIMNAKSRIHYHYVGLYAELHEYEVVGNVHDDLQQLGIR